MLYRDDARCGPQDRSHVMRAAVCPTYGPPENVTIADVPMPQAGARQVLVRIAASTVSSGDGRLRALALPRGFGLLGRLALGLRGLRQPVLGSEFSGTVVATGAGVTHFKVGDAVIGFAGVGLGCHAEYRAMSEDGALIRKPPSLSFAEAAALPFGGTTALYFLRDKGQIQRGQRVLIIGASGSVGSAAVQLARHFGATVTALCSGANADLVRQIGADAVIDYTVEDFTQRGPQFDLILDTVGAETFARARQALTRRGRFLMVAADLPQMIGGLLTWPLTQRAMAGMAPERAVDLAYLSGLAEQGAFRPVVGQIFPLDRIVDAHRLVASGRKRGNAVIAVDPEQCGGAAGPA